MHPQYAHRDRKVSPGRTWPRLLRRCLAVVGAGLIWQGNCLAETIRIGQSLPNTPESYKIATSIGYTTEALVAAVNARGGIHGVPVELVTLKDDGTPAGYARNIERLLVHDGVIAIVNCIGDRRCIEAGALVRTHDAALVGTLSGAPELRQSPTHVFPVRASYAAEASALARQLATIGVGSAVLVSDSQSVPAKRQALMDALAARAIHGELVEVAANKADIENAINALQAKMPNALLLDLSAPTVGVLGEFVVDARPALPAVIASTSDPTLMLCISIFRGKTFGFTTVVPNPESLSSPLAGQFREDVADYPLGITYLGLEAYLNLKVVIDTLERAPRPVSRKALGRALAKAGTMKIGELTVAPSGQLSDGAARVGLGVLSARGVILE